MASDELILIGFPRKEKNVRNIKEEQSIIIGVLLALMGREELRMI